MRDFELGVLHCIIICVHRWWIFNDAVMCSPTYEQNWTNEPELINRLVTDKSLAIMARGYVVDLWVYDDHFAAAKSIKVSGS